MREEVGLMYVTESVMSRPTSTSGRTMVEMPGLDVSCKTPFQWTNSRKFPIIFNGI